MNVIIFSLLFSLVVFQTQAGNFHAMTHADNLLYQKPGASTWTKVSTGDRLSGGKLKLPTRTYLLLLHESGATYSGDTSGLLDLAKLETRVVKGKILPQSSKILLSALTSFKKDKIPILDFKETVYRCRCMSTIFIFGSDSKTCVLSKGATLRWISKAPLDGPYIFKVENFFDELLYSNQVYVGKPISIDAKLMSNFSTEHALKLIVENGKEEASIGLYQMPAAEEQAYLQLQATLRNEYTSDDDLQYLVCKLLLEREHALLLDCAETFLNLYFHVSTRYGKYNDAYFTDLATERKQFSGTSKTLVKNTLSIAMNTNLPFPKLGTKVFIQVDKCAATGMSYPLGMGTIAEISGNSMLSVEITNAYQLYIRANEKSFSPGIMENSTVTVSWQE